MAGLRCPAPRIVPRLARRTPLVPSAFAAAARGAATHVVDRVIGDPHVLLGTRGR